MKRIQTRNMMTKQTTRFSQSIRKKENIRTSKRRKVIRRFIARLQYLPATVLSALLICGTVFPALSQEDTSRTVRNYRIGEVVVTGTRIGTDVRHLPMTLSVVGRQQLEESYQPSILPTLNEQVPGLFITSRGIMGYGVSTGAAGGISLRGIGGSSTTGMLVLIDGHPQYMGLMGHPIADACQTMLAERVEKGRFYGVAAGSYNRTDGHRTDMEFEQYSGYAKMGYKLSGNWKIWGDANVTHFNASNPGTVNEPYIDNDSHITRGMTSIALENHYDSSSGALSFFYNWGRHKIDDGYHPGEKPQTSHFHSKDLMMGVSWHQSAMLFTGNRLTLGFDYQHFGGESWNKVLATGERRPGVDKQMDEFAGYADFRQEIGHWLSLDAGIRIDHHSHVGTEWIPQGGKSSGTTL